MQPRSKQGVPWWLWPTVLSLDAPVVAVCWQDALARSAGVALGGPERIVLGSSVWLAYAADRWIEGWRLPAERVRTERHRFGQRRRWPLFAVWVAVLLLDVALSFRALTARELLRGAALLAAVSAYLLSHQLVHRRRRWRLPKEACTALLLGAGAAVFVVGPGGVRPGPLGAAASLFVLLCFANCVLISIWEAEVDRSHGETSLAQQFRRTGSLARSLPWLIAGGAAAVAAASAGSRPAAACAATSALLLGWVDRAEPRLGWARARVLADAALLTPLFLPLWGGGA